MSTNIPKKAVLQGVPDASESDETQRAKTFAQLLEGTSTAETLRSIRCINAPDYVGRVRVYAQDLETALCKVRGERTTDDEALQKESWFVNGLLLYVETTGRGEEAIIELFLEASEIPGEFVASAEEYAMILNIEGLSFPKDSIERALRLFAMRVLNKFAAYEQARPSPKGGPSRRLTSV